MRLVDRSENYIKFVSYLIVIILLNVVGMTLFYRVDLTSNRIYSISDISKRVVSTLSEPLTINVFFTKNLPAPHNSTERYLHDLIEEYAIYANRYFNYRFYDVSPDEGDTGKEAKENQELAKNYGIYPIQIQVIEKDEVKFQKAYMGLVLIHGDLIERIPTLTTTEGLEYRLTTAIRKLNHKISALLRLPEKIKVKLFLSSSLKIVAPYMRLNDLPDLPAKLERIVEKVNDKNYGKLKFEYLDPTKDETLEETMMRYKILNLKWPALSDGAIQAGQGAIGIVMEYGEKVVEIPLIHVFRVPLIGTRYEMVDMKKMEETIDKSVESLINIHEDLGYLASHGTHKLSPVSPADSTGRQAEETLSHFRMLASQSYSLKEVNLKEGTIPEGLNCLVVAGPTESFTNYELFQIDQFLMRGKNLALFLDNFKEVVPPGQQALSRGPTLLPLNTGFEKLLEHYGVRMKRAYVMDENSYKQKLPPQFGGGERAIYFAPLIKNEFIDHSIDFMKNIKGLIALKTSPLELKEGIIKENEIHARKLFSSSDRSWEMSGRINLNPMLIQPPKKDGEFKSMPLAYLLEGRFPSYFAGKPMPEKKTEKDKGSSDDHSKKEKKEESKKESERESKIDLSKIKGEGDVLTKGKPGKIFIMASSEMLKDNMLDEKGRGPNAAFIMNMLDFLNNWEGIADMRSKELRFNPLRETGAGIKTFVKSFNIGGLPVLVILFGLLIWFRRHSRKRHIQMMFQK